MSDYPTEAERAEWREDAEQGRGHGLHEGNRRIVALLDAVAAAEQARAEGVLHEERAAAFKAELVTTARRLAEVEGNVRALHPRRAWRSGDSPVHRVTTGPDLCDHCHVRWPCATVAALSSPATPETQRDAGVTEDCGCYACIGNRPSYPGSPLTVGMTRMIVCSECGNKRCPHGTDHRNACTGSNEPGQVGSRYPAARDLGDGDEGAGT